MTTRIRAMAASLLVLLLLSGLFATPSLLRYGSIPKGFTLEGTATGIDAVTDVTYDKKKNVFTLNKTLQYQAPLDRSLWLPMLRALLNDDRLGVSIGHMDREITYGAVSKRTAVAKDLINADRLLGGIMFARNEWLKGVKLPGDYTPAKPVVRKIRSACHFNATNFVFSKDEKNQIQCSGNTLELILIPLSNKRARDGGFLPDLKALEKGEYQTEDLQNKAHIESNMGTYKEMDAVKKALHYGEIAAFFRHLKESGIALKTVYNSAR